MSLFNTPKPQAAVAPVNPNADADAQRARVAAESAAVAEQKATGRRSTVHAGYAIAEDEQAARVKKRAATELGG